MGEWGKKLNMINDRLIITEESYKKAEKILLRLKERSIILIGGCSGTQKTETADCLQELLFNKKKMSLTLSLDDFYLVHPTIRNFNRKKQGLDSVGLKEIDWESLYRICNDFINNKTIHFRRVHKFLDAIEHNTIDSDSIDFLIVEGLYANYLKKFDYGDLSVFLEGTPEQTLEFRISRNKENENDDFRQQVVRKEFNVVSQLKRYADLILPHKINKEN